MLIFCFTRKLIFLWLSHHVCYWWYLTSQLGMFAAFFNHKQSRSHEGHGANIIYSQNFCPNYDFLLSSVLLDICQLARKFLTTSYWTFYMSFIFSLQSHSCNFCVKGPGKQITFHISTLLTFSFSPNLQSYVLFRVTLQLTFTLLQVSGLASGKSVFQETL